MEVTVKMYPEEYDLFREYQREKASLEREMSADYDRLCEKHGNLCKKSSTRPPFRRQRFTPKISPQR